jgi:hypothetical protein
MWYSIVARKEDIARPEEEVRQTLRDASRRERWERERMQRRQEENIGDRRWVWGRKSWQAGEPEGIPRWVWWEKEKWTKWLEDESTISSKDLLYASMKSPNTAW